MAQVYPEKFTPKTELKIKELWNGTVGALPRRLRDYIANYNNNNQCQLNQEVEKDEMLNGILVEDTKEVTNANAEHIDNMPVKNLFTLEKFIAFILAVGEVTSKVLFALCSLNGGKTIKSNKHSHKKSKNNKNNKHKKSKKNKNNKHKKSKKNKR